MTQKLACARETCARDHLGLGSVSKKVQQYQPSAEHIERHTQVVKEVKRKDEHDKIQAREMAQRSLESGQTDDAIDVEKFGKRPRSSNNGITRPFQTVRKREEVDMQWAKTFVSAGLRMSFFDNPEVLKTVLMTAECGQNYIRTKPGGVKEPTKLIPKLDHLIDDKNMGKMRELVRDLAATVFSDGWTAVNHHPIVNIIMGVRSLHTLRTSIDTMGQEKTMDFIAALILEHIKEIGEDARSEACRAPRAQSHQLEVGTMSGDV